MTHRLGFVSTRFAGTDGVSLESEKWARVLEDCGVECSWFAGKLDRDPERSMEFAEAFFYHPENVWINERVFGAHTRDREVTRRIYQLADTLKDALYDYVERFAVEVVVAENVLCIPMHIPLGIALTQFLQETGLPAIGHHHDFYWERSRFHVNAVSDVLEMAFPPVLPSLHHVTINTAAQQQLSLRKGQSSTLVPNVLDFEHPPAEGVAADGFRADIGLAEEDVVFLQPTRVVPRKGIEHAISLVSKLRNPRSKLLISHESGDEGEEYMRELVELAEEEGVDLRFIHTRIGQVGSEDENGHRIYSLEDAYAHADFITYPSLYEGFGNALLEAFYFKKPVLVNRYSIFVSDIEPMDFHVVKMDGYLSRRVVDEVRRVLADDAYRRSIVDHNYERARRFFGYGVLRRKLRGILAGLTGTDLPA